MKTSTLIKYKKRRVETFQEKNFIFLWVEVNSIRINILFRSVAVFESTWAMEKYSTAGFWITVVQNANSYDFRELFVFSSIFLGLLDFLFYFFSVILVLPVVKCFIFNKSEYVLE